MHHARLGLGQAQAAELPRDRQPGQAEFGRQPCVQLRAVAGIRFQRGAQRRRRKLSDQEAA
jgi:hypothetical protein